MIITEFITTYKSLGGGGVGEGIYDRVNVIGEILRVLHGDESDI